MLVGENQHLKKLLTFNPPACILHLLISSMCPRFKIILKPI